MKEIIKNIFGARVDIRGDDDCWPWVAGKFEQGYGALKVNGKQLYAHRVSFAAINGPIPKGICVLHRCDNRECVNPNHLRGGTKGENNTDRSQKGRSATGDRAGARTCPESRAYGVKNGAYTKPHRIRRGIDNGNAKLNEAMVREIFALYATGMFQAVIAEKMGVSQVAVSSILRRKTWRGVSVETGNCASYLGRGSRGKSTIGLNTWQLAKSYEASDAVLTN